MSFVCRIEGGACRDCDDATIAVERVPLVFSYALGESWVKLKENKLKSSDWQVYPTTPWNYALAVNQNLPERFYQGHRKSDDLAAVQFSVPE